MNLMKKDEERHLVDNAVLSLVRRGDVASLA